MRSRSVERFRRRPAETQRKELERLLRECARTEFGRRYGFGEIRTPGQQLIVVCGCGGDRDRTKRPEMAQIAVKYASTAIFTSDNPRHESPEAILDDMVAGLDPGVRYLRIADRAEAIRTAVMLSRPGDILLIAGKGHETYQIVGDVKHHFDDREEVRKSFELLN